MLLKSYKFVYNVCRNKKLLLFQAFNGSSENGGIIKGQYKQYK